MRRVATLALAALLAGLAAVPTPAFAAAPDLPPAVQSLQTCVQSSHRLLVLDLIDASGSLVGSDPGNQRVVGIKAQLAGLARLARERSGERPIEIEVALASFSGRYQAGWPGITDEKWIRVNERTLPRLQASVDELAARNRGFNTDYATALTNARNDLSERSTHLTAEGGAPPCMALVWFTDGKYDIRPRKTGPPQEVSYAPGIPITNQSAADRVMEAGRNTMCAADSGVVDQIRADQVKIFAIGLDEKPQAGELDFLKSVSDGSGTEPCGTQFTPDSGLYLPATEGGRLLFLFSSLFDLPATEQYCPEPGKTTCQFTTAAGLSGFTLVIQAPHGADRVALAGPNGQRAELSQGGPFDTTISGAQVTAQWFSPQALEIDAALPGTTTSWVGTWTMAFVVPEGATDPGTYTLRLRADLFPSAQGPTRATVGEQATIALGFTDANGHAVGSSPLLNGASLQATLVDLASGSTAPLTTVPAGDGRWTTTFTPAMTKSDVPRLALDLSALLGATAGVTVRTAPRRVELSIAPPHSFPSASPTSVQMKSVRGRDGRSEDDIKVAGPERGAGCVWVADSTAGPPQLRNATRIEVSPRTQSPANCITVRAGETKTFRITARVREQATGRARGTLNFYLQGTSGKVLRTPVQVSFDMRPAPDAGTAWALFIALLVTGVVFPLALLAAANVAGARFTSPQTLRFLARDVEVSSSGLTPVGSGELLPSLLDEFDLVANEPSMESKSTLRINERFTFSAHPFGRRGERRLSLFRGPYGSVEVPSGKVIAGAYGGDLRPFESGAHEVPLSLAGTWVFALDDMERSGEPMPFALDGDEAPPVRGRLLLLFPSHASDQAQRLSVAAEQGLMRRHQELAAAAGERVANIDQPSLAARVRARFRRPSAPPAETPKPEDLYKTRS